MNPGGREEVRKHIIGEESKQDEKKRVEGQGLIKGKAEAQRLTLHICAQWEVCSVETSLRCLCCVKYF